MKRGKMHVGENLGKVEMAQSLGGNGTGCGKYEYPELIYTSSRGFIFRSMGFEAAN